MGTGVRMLAVAALAAAIALPAAGSDKQREKEEACKSRVVENLMIAIKSDNDGLRESAAYMLGEVKCTNAVVPLLGILHSDPRESARTVAALALCRIGDPRGLYAVKRAVVFDESPLVQLKCAWFYNQYVRDGTFAFGGAAPAADNVAVASK